MLLSEKLWIKAGAKNFNYFKNLGYDIESSKEIFEVDVEDLTLGTNVLVDVMTRIKKGTQLPDNMIEPYLLYRRQVDNISDKLKIDLLKIWDGYDYYDLNFLFVN